MKDIYGFTASRSINFQRIINFLLINWHKHVYLFRANF